MADGVGGLGSEAAERVHYVVGEGADAFGAVIDFLAMVIEMGLDHFSQPGGKVGYFFQVTETETIHEDAHKNGPVFVGRDRHSMIVQPLGRPEDDPFEEAGTVFGEGNRVARVELSLKKVEKVG